MNVMRIIRIRKMLPILLVAVFLSVYVRLSWDFYEYATAPQTGDPGLDKYTGLAIILHIFALVLIMPPCFISQLLILFGINRIRRNKLSGVPTNFFIWLSLFISVLLFAVYILQVIFHYPDELPYYPIVPVQYLYAFSLISLVLYIVGKCLTGRREKKQETNETSFELNQNDIM